MQRAVETWVESAPKLQALYERFQRGDAEGAFAFEPAAASAPLPRAYQWCDGSAFLNHGELMEKALGVTPQTVFKWMRKGRLSGRQLTKGQPWQINLSDDEIKTLAAQVRRTSQSTIEAS